MNCSECQSDVPIEDQDFMLCSVCVEKLSEVDFALFLQIKLMFLQKMEELEETDPLDGSPISINSYVHHKRGCIGFADAIAREKNISLLIDVRHFLAVNRISHCWIRNNPELAKAKGFFESSAKIVDGE